jgi:DNA-binding XRE family transcriptional regulator
MQEMPLKGGFNPIIMKKSLTAWTRNTKPANEARRGVRLNNPGPDWPEVRHQLNELGKYRHATKSLTQLALRLRVPRKTIWKWKTGKHYPTSAVARRIKEYLKQ